MLHYGGCTVVKEMDGVFMKVILYVFPFFSFRVTTLGGSTASPSYVTYLFPMDTILKKHYVCVCGCVALSDRKVGDGGCI